MSLKIILIPIQQYQNCHYDAVLKYKHISKAFQIFRKRY